VADDYIAMNLNHSTFEDYPYITSRRQL